MKVLYIAPLPPPITGQSIVSKVLLEGLENKHEVQIVNLSKDSLKNGVNGIGRVFEILRVLWAVLINIRKADKVYITISESFAGNIKDLCIYCICIFKLKSVYVHLHGGTIKRELWDRYKYLSKINKFFIKRLGGVFISGRGHLPIFGDIISVDRIHIVPNFAEDYLFVDHGTITEKFNSRPIKLIYMSNLIPRKGYLDLLEAYIGLPYDVKQHVQLSFAGAFETEQQKQNFLEEISKEPNVKYCGIVSGEQKRRLFAESHVFCLPTTLFEGQPISILEAYASGCVVVTTGQPGIYDIFEAGVNGFEILPSSPISITIELSKIIQSFDKMVELAHRNLSTAEERYRTFKYQNSVIEVLER